MAMIAPAVALALQLLPQFPKMLQSMMDMLDVLHQHVKDHSPEAAAAIAETAAHFDQAKAAVEAVELPNDPTGGSA
jgi:hypothetical protein